MNSWKEWKLASKSKPRLARVGSEEDGYTLTELLVVLIILSLLIGLIGARVIGYVGSAKVDTAAIQIEQVKTTLDLFLIDNGRYPTSEEGLIALIESPTGLAGWRGPYLSDDKVPVDPWGSPYVYKIRDDGTVSIVSLGADKVTGGEGENSDIGR